MTRRAALRLLCRLLAPAGGHLPLPRRDADWRQLVALALRAHVATALHPALLRAGRLERVPAPLAGALAALHALNRRRNGALLADLARVAHVLNGIGIVPTVLKGGALLADGAYADLGERLLADLDLLVSPAALRCARRALEADGYRATGAAGARHHLPPLAHPRREILVELHWQAVPEARGRRALAALGGETGRVVAFRGAHIRMPSPAALVAHRVLHDFLHDRGYQRGWAPLRGMLDVARLLERDDAGVDWSGLERAFARAGLAPVLRAYRHTLHRHFPQPAAPAAGVAARLWHWRFAAHQQWPALYAATRHAFHRARPWLSRQWLRYWGWPTTTPGG